MATSHPLLCHVSRFCLLRSDGRELSDKEKSLRDGASAAGTSNMEAKGEISWVSCAINPADPGLQSLLTV